MSFTKLASLSLVPSSPCNRVGQLAPPPLGAVAVVRKAMTNIELDSCPPGTYFCNEVDNIV